jgi:hypothetical protein
MVGIAKGESNIRGRNKGRTYLLIFFPIISIVGDGVRRGIIKTLFACLKLPRANWDVVSCNMSFSMFLSKNELGCCTLEEHLNDAYIEHTM